MIRHIKTILLLCMIALCMPACSSAGALTRIYIAPHDVGLLVGARQQFTVIGEDADGNEAPVGSVTWSATAAAGSIGSSGLFTAGSTAGNYRSAVTASAAGGLTATANVEVYSATPSNGYMLERSVGSLSAGAYSAPMDIAIDGSGNVYVINQFANSIVKFDSAGHLLSQFKLGYSVGATALLGVSSNGTMYVADPASYTIRKYSPSGSLAAQWGSSGTGNGQFTELTDMAVDSTGLVYVTDAAAARIHVFSVNGEFVRSWSTQLCERMTGRVYDAPAGAIDVDRSGRLCAVVSGGPDWDCQNELVRYDSQGNKLSASAINITLWYRPVGDRMAPWRYAIAVDASGSLYHTLSNFIYRVMGISQSAMWGGYGQLNGQFDGASGIAVDSAGKIYVSDQGNNRIQVFSANGQFLSAWSSSGIDKGQLKSPSGIAVDSTGNIFVSDTGNRRLQQFDFNGGFVQELASRSQKDSAFACPGGLVTDGGGVLAVDAIGDRVLGFSSTGSLASNWTLPTPGDGSIPSSLGIVRDASAGSFYVVDANRNCAYTLGLNGNYISSWLSAGTGDGQVQSPAGICLADGYRFVSDYGNNRIQKFSGDTYAAKWGSAGTGNGQFNGPAGICADSSGTIYVADSGNGRIQKFSSAGAYTGQLGTLGFGRYQMLDPEAVAVDSLGSVYVADTGNHRILKFVNAVLSVSTTSPTDQPTFSTNYGTIDLAGTASLFATSVTWSSNRGGSGTCAGVQTWSATIPLKPGSNVVTITATDASGATATDTLTVTSLAPSVTITSPTSGVSYCTTASTVKAGGTAFDDVGIRAISWTNDRGGSGACIGSLTWTTPLITLQPGGNIITVTARDAAGNTGSDRLLVFRQIDSTSKISQLKAGSDVGGVYLANQVVTAVFADCLYIEQADRTAGLKVKLLYPADGVSIGSRVDAAGTLRTEEDGERFIDGTVTLRD